MTIMDSDATHWFIIKEDHRDENCRFHREDGPALTYANGDQEWFIHGNHHREDGPAIIWGETKEWWVNGIQYDPLTWMIKVHDLKNNS